MTRCCSQCGHDWDAQSESWAEDRELKRQAERRVLGYWAVGAVLVSVLASVGAVILTVTR